MKEIKVNRAKRPVFLIVLAVIIYTLHSFWEPLVFVSMGCLLLAVVSYWKSCRCPYCNEWLKVGELQHVDVYQCPKCENKIKIIK